MNRTRDELAGVVDLFGALSRAELTRALAELAFKRGQEVEEAALAAEIDDAVAEYYLVAVERDGETLLAPGPVAFPTLAERASDLPHILDVERRSVDRAALGEAVATRLREESEAAVEADDADRAATLLDASYDVEAWAPVELDCVRATLTTCLDE